MQEQDREEQQVLESLQEHQARNLSQTISSLLRGLAAILIIGLAALYYISPDHVLRIVGRSTLPQLPTRNLLLLFPEDAIVKRHLPRLFQNYALATPQNAPARAYLQQAAAIRNIATDRGLYRKQQSVQLHTWEVRDEFLRQLPTISQQDGVCGQGFAHAFAAYEDVGDPALRAKARHDLIVFCMMSLGTHDGFVHWDTTVEASLTRGLKGLAAVSDGMVHTDLLLLPILSNEQIQDKQKGRKNIEPSTLVAVRALYWLIQRGTTELPTSLEAYNRDFGVFLYGQIKQEGDAWVLLKSACTSEDADHLHSQYRRIATTCLTPTTNEATLESENNAGCCSHYDPSIKPFVHYRRRNEDETKHNEDDD